MGITHVVRGEDHLSNTPRQLMILQALGAEPPIYAHLPLLHGPDGKKLSKRHGAASVQELRATGYLPEAVRNYLALLGWGYDESTTFFTTDELIERFSLERVSKNPAVFDEQKLRWMNAQLPARARARRARARCSRSATGATTCASAAEIAQEKLQTLDDFWPLRRLPVRAARDRPDGVGQGDEGRRRSRTSGRAREALADVEPVGRRSRRGRPARRRGRARGQAEGGLPADPRGDHAAPRSRPGSSSRWPCWAATRRLARIDAALNLARRNRWL